MPGLITIFQASDLNRRRRNLLDAARDLPTEDAAAFVTDVSRALYASCCERSVKPARSVLAEWKATAEALSDALSRDTLLGDSGDDDYVEAGHPEWEPTTGPAV